MSDKVSWGRKTRVVFKAPNEKKKKKRNREGLPELVQWEMLVIFMTLV